MTGGPRGRGAAGPSPARRRRQAVISAAALVVIAVVVIVTWVIDNSHDGSSSSGASSSGVSSTSAPSNTRVPARVRQTLALIDAGTWPAAANAPGTRGGIVFRNNEGRLPSTTSSGKAITYREWDVNPKEPGRSRDAERIVTGSDGSAWYTDDHYQTFVLIRGPTS
ncbi:putative guanyl-specific ribonuclease [Gordonia polyisoprenivorans NBRC 16320 = JCM 10675]|uniref:Guanine-specific ribonuclease N1 and T1 n=1 Tax=Gordonia polyisoprenivorans TaxID=84595 RepID=A0A846WI49_9ACTN|nr:ribonuclease domain-containing protein [Gordonia polyisoprenivorans]NKY00071.1 guanine-specific ribonuclease N1 and T1 [Gordonia polyisoprenivorans]QUD82004.1 guanine-specific ribonuclease N1 and T1 [Gordonia polyisoprenivorans]GAB25694.1 putative guanyl-specific ribonuclease [Gordonia polyisoprenivorans NBRC 16320 = JCM 10675]